MKILRLNLMTRLLAAAGVTILFLCLLFLYSIPKRENIENQFNLAQETILDCARVRVQDKVCADWENLRGNRPELYCFYDYQIPTGVDCSRLPPKTLNSFAWERAYKAPAQNSLLAGLITFLILSIPAFYLNERSKGWRRASLVISIGLSLTSFLFLSFSPKKYHLNISPWIFAMMCFAVLIISLLKGKSLYAWVKEGFIQDKTPDLPIKSEDTFNTKNIASTPAESSNPEKADERATYSFDPTTAPKTHSIMNWSKGALATGGGFLILFLALMIGKFMGLVTTDKMSGAKHSGGDKSSVIRKLSDEMNKQLPEQLDKYTRIDSTSAGPGNLITYYYTLTEFDADPAALPAARDKAREIIRGVCIGSGQKMLDDGITMEYIYRDRNGEEFTRFEITQADCKTL